MNKLTVILLLVVISLLAANLQPAGVTPAQLGITDPPFIHDQEWRMHDRDRPQPEIVVPGDQSLPVAPPSDAIVLFDGTDLEHFQNQDLEIEDGAMVMGKGGQQTIASFGDIQLHVEWSSPRPPRGDDQNRGNSGIKLMGLYEIQVLDGYQNATYADGLQGALYGQYPPMVNASKPPGEWQSYDIYFKAPRFKEDKSLDAPAYVTVVHNGVLIQHHRAFLGPTRWRARSKYEYHASKLPLSLQWHQSPVRYRNIWVRPLDQHYTSEEGGQ